MNEESTQYKYCKGCGMMLPVTYPKDYCPGCEELALFDEVRDYIRSNDVNEYDVAEHFDIPIKQVKDWIKDGRIEYKENGKQSVGASFCLRCGAKVSFGTLCPKCLKLLNGQGQGFAATPVQDEGKMRFIDTEGK